MQTLSVPPAVGHNHFFASHKSFLEDLSARTRGLDDPDQVTWETVRAVGEYLKVSRCTFAAVDESAGTLTVTRDWSRQSVPSAVGTYLLESIGVDVISTLRSGRPFACSDIYTNACIPKEHWDPYRALDIRSLLTVPIHRGGTLIGILNASDSAPREWTNDEIALLDTIADRTWLAAENAILFQTLNRREQELAAAFHREELINEIGRVVRTISEPAAIQAAVVEILGPALDLDRCCYMSIEPDRDCLTCAHDWHHPDLPPINSTFRYSLYRAGLEELFKDRETVVIDSQHDAPSTLSPILDAFGRSAVLAVPLYDNDRLGAAIIASMVDRSYVWSAGEISLIQRAATLTRNFVNAARIAQREHAIATRLQNALQPTIDEGVPGLDLMAYHRPALDEASIGGDFYDVFPLTPGVHALIVGDLSGKGLSAAVQVAAVRNMLRYALYNSQCVDEAIMELNTTIVDHGIINGFATVFAARYDTASHTLTYVNCGQEPALLASVDQGERHVEILPPTGPVLGMASGVLFRSQSVRMQPGDVFAMFTDGFTEIGYGRGDLTGPERLLNLVAALPADTTAADVVSTFVDCVKTADEIVRRDDQCLLVAVAV